MYFNNNAALMMIVTIFFAVATLLGCDSNDGHNSTGEDTATGLDTDDRPFTYDPSVPQSCEEVNKPKDERLLSSVGCLFYSVSLDATYPSSGFSVVIGNVNAFEPASYTIYGSDWDFVEGKGEWKEMGSDTIAPLTQKVVKDLAYIAVNNNPYLYSHPDENNAQTVLRKGAYKIVSDVPIVAYQFNPLNKGAFSADASMLIPASSWGEEYQVLGYKTVRPDDAALEDTKVDMHLGYFAVVASKDGTEVTIDPSTLTRAGYELWSSDEIVVPATTEPFTVSLDESDVLFVHADTWGQSLTGSTVQSDAEHPVAVFTGHQCALIPDYAWACDNIEEQLPATINWGRQFVASRYPNRNLTNHTDPVLWQISASADDTLVEFDANENVKGLPAQNVTLNKGESLELYVYGGVVDPGDFAINASKPIAVLQYMTGAGITSDQDGDPLNMGDPAVSYLPPVGQFLSRYIVNVPGSWDKNFLVISRVAGQGVFLDGTLVEDSLFRAIPKTTWESENDTKEWQEWEVGRVWVQGGAHIVESSDPRFGIGLTVVGYDDFDSYAYTGGMGFRDLTIPQ